MATENALWDTLRRRMKGWWVPQRFEDKLSYGIPDVGFVLKGAGPYGFIELKRVKEFPKRPTTVIRIPHPEHWKIQQAWIRRVGRLTGRVFLLLQVAKTYFLFDWRETQLVGELPKDRLYELSLGYWENSINRAELYELLSGAYWYSERSKQCAD